MNNWKVISNILLGIGSVIVLWGLIAFLLTLSTLEQTPIGGEILIVTALGVATPHFIGASLLLVVGGVILYSVNQDESAEYYAEEKAEKEVLDKLNKLEKNIDTHFTAITQRLEKIEEKQS